MTPNSDFQFIHKESGNSMTTAKLQSARLLPHWRPSTLDQNLSGSSMITKIISKCNNKIKFLYRNANNLDKQTKMLLTSALIQCHFDYGSSMWYTGTTCRMKKKLQITQNKVIRFILGLPSRSHIGVTKFSSACMLPVPLRVDQLKLNHMLDNQCYPYI